MRDEYAARRRSGSIAASTDPRVREAIEVLRSVPPRELQRLGLHFQAADFDPPPHLLDFLDANRDFWAGLDAGHGVDWNLVQDRLLRDRKPNRGVEIGRAAGREKPR